MALSVCSVVSSRSQSSAERIERKRGGLTGVGSCCCPCRWRVRARPCARTTFLWIRTSLCIASACKFRTARWWDATTLLATTVRHAVGVRGFVNEIGPGAKLFSGPWEGGGFSVRVVRYARDCFLVCCILIVE